LFYVLAKPLHMDRLHGGCADWPSASGDNLAHSARMDAPRRFSRRSLFRLAGAGLFLGFSAEAARVFALTNKHTVIPGQIYRSAQLSPEGLESVIAKRGIRTVINLRGTCPDVPWYIGEARTTHAANVSHEDLSLSAKRYPAPDEIRRMVEVLDHSERPVIIHCQRGADRTGLVSMAACLLYTSATLDEARRQLWPRYGHIRGGRTVVIDEFFEFYESWLAGRPHTPDLFRDWAINHYCPGPFRAELSLVGNPTVEKGRGFTITVRAKNASLGVWQFHMGSAGGIQLRGHLFSTKGPKLYTTRAGHFERTVPPGETIDLVLGFPPVQEPGSYLIHADLLDSQAIDLLDSDFVQYGSDPLLFHLTVTAR
jgi:protein tyrosine phosphatase (PTP) superfamily phosphohydrolase (DUF442 family)